MKLYQKMVGGVLSAALALSATLPLYAEQVPLELVPPEKAMEAALADTPGTPLQLSLDSGRTLAYDIEVMDSSGYRREIEVDALSGEVQYSRREEKLYSYQQYKKAAVAWSDAWATAQDSLEGGKSLSFELERERSSLVYQVETLDEDGVEHTVRIDAATGEILSTKRDRISTTSAAGVSPGEAEAAALKALGGGLVACCRLESDDGSLVYEVLAVDADGQVWELTLSAKTGRVLERERAD